MKLATFQTGKGASYGIVNGNSVTDLGARLGSKYPDLLTFIAAKGDAKGAKPGDAKAAKPEAAKGGKAEGKK